MIIMIKSIKKTILDLHEIWEKEKSITDYYINSKSFFDYKCKSLVDESDFEKILKGQIVNSSRFEGHNVDCSFFLVSRIGLSAFDNYTETKTFHKFPNIIDNEFYNSEWFGYFWDLSESHIVIPNEKWIQMKYNDPINPKNVYSIRHNQKILIDDFKGSVWAGGGSFQYDKNLDDKVLVTDISVSRMKEIVKDVFSSYDPRNKLDSL